MTTAGTPAAPTASEPAPASHRPSDASVIEALIRRELKLRFGEEWLGVLGAYMMPLVWVAAVYMAFKFFGRSTPVYTDLITFIISGLIPYAAFRFTVNAMNRSRTLVRSLLIYPTVGRRHAVVATGLVELFNSFVVVAIVMGVNYFVFGNWEMEHPFDFTFGILLSWLLGAGFGYIFVNLSELKQIWWLIGQALLRPSFFISGVFFTGNEVPERLYDYFGWNPLLHAIEVTRTGMLDNYESRVASPTYAILCIVGLFAVGLGTRAVLRD
ncbi:hypothetical protein EKN06_06670 [Croceicoccus ponticola]|uniref:ABC-2 type transporter transmembrane domain-containing protein n=1 Tax=Croceicoccus ponticola TaxID=2217664 RepID=A0A437GY76_9SPHN|nr:ABC transporter permease [Croceicoccus ponticola]RVQ67623.1 hypothetical protein EKN06_06670 [Croceicoccus ponticola]